MRIYVSGKISGLPIDKAKEFFEVAEAKLKKSYPEAEIINPFKIDHSKAYAMEAENKAYFESIGPNVINPRPPYSEKQLWTQYMKEDLAALFHCDAIHMLQNWVYSIGARIEHASAKELSLPVSYEQ